MIERALLIFGGALVAMFAVNIALKSWDVLEGASLIARSERARQKFRQTLRVVRRLNARPRPIIARQMYWCMRGR